MRQSQTKHAYSTLPGVNVIRLPSSIQELLASGLLQWLLPFSRRTTAQGHEQIGRACLGCMQALDADKNGSITMEELREGMARQGSKVSQVEIQQLLAQMDADQSGTIDCASLLEPPHNYLSLAPRHLNALAQAALA